VTLGPKLPTPVRAMAAFIAEKGMKDPIFAHCLRSSRHRSVRQYRKASFDRRTYNDKWNKEVWDAHGFDAIIAPVLSVPALPHGMTKTLSPLAAGTILYNIVDSTVGVIPVTRVDSKLDQLTEEWKGPHPSMSRSVTPSERSSNSTAVGPSEGSGRHGSKMIETSVYSGSMGEPKAYRPDEMDGLPLGIQIVGRPFEDEKIIAVMSLIDGLLGKRGFGPGSSSKSI